MNTPHSPGSSLPADKWLDEKLNSAGRKFCHQRQMLEQAVAARPLTALAAGIGFGCITGRLPLTRITASAIRLSLSCLPPALLVIGAMRSWQLLRPLAAPSSKKADLEGWDPAAG
jgi:hypothetical protein